MRKMNWDEMAEKRMNEQYAAAFERVERVERLGEVAVSTLEGELAAERARR